TIPDCAARELRLWYAVARTWIMPSDLTRGPWCVDRSLPPVFHENYGNGNCQDRARWSGPQALRPDLGIEIAAAHRPAGEHGRRAERLLGRPEPRRGQEPGTALGAARPGQQPPVPDLGEQRPAERWPAGAADAGRDPGRQAPVEGNRAARPGS